MRGNPIYCNKLTGEILIFCDIVSYQGSDTIEFLLMREDIEYIILDEKILRENFEEIGKL